MLLSLALLALSTVVPGTRATREEPVVPAWADLLDAEPSSKVVRSADFRKRILSSGYAWRVRDRATGIEMLLVPAGTYVRGASPELKRPPTEELPRHQVTISAPFYLARYETQEKEWDRLFDGTEPEKAPGLPVWGRSYADVEAFLRRANAGSDPSASPLRLPTEGEWEYACRAGNERAQYGKSLAKVAWFNGNANKQVHVVGEKEANDLGFHDMLGNVCEWCSDCYDPAEYERVVALAEESGEDCVDPTGSPDCGKGRTLRGGGIHHAIDEVTASTRMRAFRGPEKRPYGFRVARNP